MLSVEAAQLNEQFIKESPIIFNALSALAKKLCMPRGIVYQSSIAKEKAHFIDATIGIGMQNKEPIYFDTIYKVFRDYNPMDIFPYASAVGRPKLRKLWREKIYKENPSLGGKIISTPIVTSAITHALTLAADIFCDKDTPVLLSDKLWGNYRGIFETMHQAKLNYYSLFDDNYEINYQSLQKAICNFSIDEKLVLLLNYPNNPIGYTLTNKQSDILVNLLVSEAQKGRCMVIILDDAYGSLSYEEDCMPGSLFGKLCGVNENIIAVKVDGATKDYFYWGFRLGFITFGFSSSNLESVYEIMEKKVKGLIRATVSNCSHVAQTILEDAMQKAGFIEEQKQKQSLLKARYLKCKEILQQAKYKEEWVSYPFNAGYFLCLKLKNVSASKLWDYMLNKYGIGTIYIDETDLRIAYSSVDEDKLEILFETIYKSIVELKAINN